MLRKFVLLFSMFVVLIPVKAQNNDAKTVLFLIPFFCGETDSFSVSNMETPMDIYNDPRFSLISFWQGAQLALEEFVSSNKSVNVIVRDITQDNAKLIALLEDETLMKNVDLIIGPFFARQFEVAENYALKYKIPIVNPFTTKRSILTNNPYVYKVSNNHAAMPNLLEEKWKKSNFPQLIVWHEKNTENTDYKLYTDYFRQHDIPYQDVVVGEGKSLMSWLHNDRPQWVVALLKSDPMVISQMRNLGVENNFPNTLFFIPKGWLSINELEIDYLNKLNVHFFSPDFVDYDATDDLLFISDFIEKKSTPPDLNTYTFQGYDITKYFLDLMFNDFDHAKVKVKPVAMKFDFVKIENGGYENQGVFLLQLKDYSIQLSE